MKIMLTLHEKKCCKHIAYNCPIDALKDYENKTNYTDEEIRERRFNALCAERAFCRLFNLYPASDHETVNLVYDCIHNDYGTVDVKGTMYMSGKLIVQEHKIKKPAEHYALMVGTVENGFEYRGSITATQIFEQGNLQLFNGNKKPVYLVAQSALIYWPKI